jgi:energy-coupling factor transporter transmembrane protein EcfT
LFLRGVAVVLAITAAVLPFFLGGNPAAGAALTLRAGLACAAALVFADGLARTDLGASLRALGLPAGFATVIASLQQQARIIGDEGRRVLLARRLRGAKGRGLGLGVLSTLFVRSARRAERVDFARSLRGYRIDDAARAARLTSTDIVPLATVLVLATAPHWLASLLDR